MGQRDAAMVFQARGVECDSSCFQWPCVLVEFLTDATAPLERVRERWSSLGCALFGLRNTSLQIKGVEWGKLVSRTHTGTPAAITAWRSCFHSLGQHRPFATAAVVVTGTYSAVAVSCWVWVVRCGHRLFPTRWRWSSRLVKVNLPVKQTPLQTAGAPVTSEPHRASRREPQPSHLALLLPTTLGTLTRCCCVWRSFKDKCKKITSKQNKSESKRDCWDISHWHFGQLPVSVDSSWSQNGGILVASKRQIKQKHCC